MYIKFKKLFLILLFFQSSYCLANEVELEKIDTQILQLVQKIKAEKKEAEDSLISYDEASHMFADIVKELYQQNDIKALQQLLKEVETNKKLKKSLYQIDLFLGKLIKITNENQPVTEKTLQLRQAVIQRSRHERRLLHLTLKIATLKLQAQLFKRADILNSPDISGLAFNSKVWSQMQIYFQENPYHAVSEYINEHAAIVDFNTALLKVTTTSILLQEIIEFNKELDTLLTPSPEDSDIIIDDILIPAPSQQLIDTEKLADLDKTIRALSRKKVTLATQQRQLPTNRSLSNELSEIAQYIQAVNPTASAVSFFYYYFDLHGRTPVWHQSFIDQMWLRSRKYPEALKKLLTFENKLNHRDSVLKSNTLIPLSVVYKKLQTLRYLHLKEDPVSYRKEVILSTQKTYEYLQKKFRLFSSHYLIQYKLVDTQEKLAALIQSYTEKPDTDILEEIINVHFTFMAELGKT